MTVEALIYWKSSFSYFWSHTEFVLFFLYFHLNRALKASLHRFNLYGISYFHHINKIKALYFSWIDGEDYCTMIWSFYNCMISMCKLRIFKPFWHSIILLLIRISIPKFDWGNIWWLKFMPLLENWMRLL
jgi:hypothetical protein